MRLMNIKVPVEAQDSAAADAEYYYRCTHTLVLTKCRAFIPSSHAVPRDDERTPISTIASWTYNSWSGTGQR
jgi:hypothetical protein